MWAPNSYTKENVVEIQSHGGALVVRRILELALQMVLEWQSQVNLQNVLFKW